MTKNTINLLYIDNSRKLKKDGKFFLYNVSFYDPHFRLFLSKFRFLMSIFRISLSFHFLPKVFEKIFSARCGVIITRVVSNGLRNKKVYNRN